MVLAVLTVVVSCNRSPELTSRSDSQGPLQQAIVAGGEYLVDACGPDGQFVYRVHLDPRETPEPKYNIVRHAGTIYALGMIDRYQSSPAVRDTMLRAAEWMKRTSLHPVPNESDLQAIWSFPEIEGSGGPADAKLGGTGLGLVALMSVERISPGVTSLEQLRSLGRFIVFMQREDGSYYSKYTPEYGGRDGRWESLYYPGEAALGLLMLDQRDPSPTWRETAIKTLLYLARIRRDLVTVEADHWALLATARLFAQSPDSLQAVQRQAIMQHAVQVCRCILADCPAWAVPAGAEGSLTPDCRTCPTATRLEGLTAALTFLPDDEVALRQDIRSAVDRGIGFLDRARIRSGPYRGGIPRELLAFDPDGSWYFPNDRAGEIRIDYVQHAVSAMIQYDALARSGCATAALGPAAGVTNAEVGTGEMTNVESRISRL
jgi:hypothetical protein